MSVLIHTWMTEPCYTCKLYGRATVLPFFLLLLKKKNNNLNQLEIKYRLSILEVLVQTWPVALGVYGRQMRR